VTSWKGAIEADKRAGCARRYPPELLRVPKAYSGPCCLPTRSACLSLARDGTGSGTGTGPLLARRLGSLQPDLGSLADVRMQISGVCICLRQRRRSQRLSEIVSTAAASANLIRVHPLHQCPRLLVVAGSAWHQYTPLVLCRTIETLKRGRGLRTRCCKGDRMRE
jgi:hypothetical protein